MNLKPIFRAIKKYAPIALTIIAGAGTVVTAIEAVKETNDAINRICEKTEEKGEELTLTEKVLAAAPAYKKTAIAGFVTLSCGTGSLLILWRRQNLLTEAINRDYHLLRRYTEAMTATAGAEGVDLIGKYLAEQSSENIPNDNPDEDGKILVYDEYADEWFRAEESDIYWSFYNALGCFADEQTQYCKVSTLYNGFGVDCPKKMEHYGWVMDYDWINEWCEYANTIEFYLSDTMRLDDGLEYRLLVYGKPPRFYPDL